MQSDYLNNQTDGRFYSNGSMQFNASSQSPAGVYLTGSRLGVQGAAQQIPNAGYPFNGDRTYPGPDPTKIMGQAAQVIEHGGKQHLAGLTIKVNALLWSNGWEQMYDRGLPLFRVGINPEMMGEKLPPRDVLSRIYSSLPEIYVVPAQLQALLREAWRNFHEAQIAETSTLTAFADATNPAEKPFSYLATLHEFLWSDPTCENLEILVKTATGDLAARFRTIEDVVRTAYRIMPHLGLCNGIFIRNHVRLAGIIEATGVGEEPNSFQLTVAVANGAYCVNYWGPYCDNGYRVGFVITKCKDSMLPEHERPTGWEEGSFVLEPWHHPSSYTVSHSISIHGTLCEKKEDSQLWRAKSYYTYQAKVDDTLKELKGDPIQFNLGQILTRAEVDYARQELSYQTQGKLRMETQCFNLVALSGAGRVETDSAHRFAKSLNRPLYISVTMAKN